MTQIPEAVVTGRPRKVSCVRFGVVTLAVAFTLWIYVWGPFVDRFELLPDQGVTWQ